MDKIDVVALCIAIVCLKFYVLGWLDLRIYVALAVF